MQYNVTEQNVIMDSIGEGVIITDINGNVIFLNSMAQKLTDLVSKEAQGKPINKVFNIADSQTGETIENMIYQVIETGEKKVMANGTTFIAKNGSKYQINNSSTPIKDADGNINGVVVVFSDVTEKYQMQKEFSKIQKFKSIGILAGGIAHDFNNILMGLYGNISIAKANLSKDHPGFRPLEEAESSMNRATHLTRQLLTFAKDRALIMKDINIGKLAEEIVSFDLSGSNIISAFAQPKNLWKAKVDKGYMQQVFSNLTINARQAMPDGGHLYIMLENTDISKNIITNLNQGKYVKITFQDEGTGIDKNYLDQIFDPYFSTKQTGSGLGLATTYSIINKHKGHINVTSKLGKGTTFTIYLPASESQKLPKKKQQAAKWLDTEQSGKILVMDDEKIIRQVTKEMLEKNGYQVETADGGKQAIEMYEQSMNASLPFDAVIMDITIPGGIGGKEAIKKILVIDPEAKVIVSSGYSDNPVMSNYAHYGFKGTIAKPYTTGKLQEVLNQVLTKHLG